MDIIVEMENAELQALNNPIKEVPKKCGICGDPHYYRDCKYTVITTKVLDAPIPTRARLSLPHMLEIKKLADETHSVFTKALVEVGTEFGPFVAQKNLTLHPLATFSIKVFNEDESDLSSYYLDTTDENECCWMMFVTTASHVEEQNLICYQEGQDIFFGAIKDIHPGQELKVWYSPYCAFKMQKPTLTFKDSSTMQLNLATNDPEDLNTIIKEQQKIIPRTVWNCKFCYKLEKKVIDFAKHLLTHYADRVKTCEHCQAKFRYTVDYKKHLKIVHEQGKKEKPAKKMLTAAKPQEQANVTKHLTPQNKKNNVGGPLLLQCFADSLDNSNSLLPQSEMQLLDMENYDNPGLLLDENLRFNLDVIGTDMDMELNNCDEGKSMEENKEYVCDICLKKFVSPKGIVRHLKMHIGKYYCDSCKKVFGRPENLNQHKCNRIFTFKCRECNKVFYQKKFLERHISVYHDGKYVCDACQKNCYSATGLERHFCTTKMPQNQPVFKCTKCSVNKSFQTERGLQLHLQNNHTSKNGVSNYICSECSKTFSSRSIYQRHLVCVHRKSKNYECEVCSKVFHRKDILKMHVANKHMTLEQNAITCSICKKDFKSKRGLNEHMKLTHSSTKYECNQCNTTFKYSRNLHKHLQLYHNNVKNSVENPCAKEHECPICQVKVKLKNSLLRHMKKKHPEKCKNMWTELNHVRYQCSMCKSKMKSKESFKRHAMKNHPKDWKSLLEQFDKNVCLLEKDKKETKLVDEDFDNYMDLQKTIENMDFNMDTCNDNLLSGSETIDKFLKESSDQISILFADSPRANHREAVTILNTQSNRDVVGLSMPDLCEIEHDNKLGKSILTNSFEQQTSIPSPDVVLYVVNDKGY